MSTESAVHNSTRAIRRKKQQEWFYRGRILAGTNSPELRVRAYRAKMAMRNRPPPVSSKQMAPGRSTSGNSLSGTSVLGTSFFGTWTPLGPVPLASDASGTGIQDYRQVAGRTTAIAIDPADATGNTVYIGSAQGGIWKSSNGTNPIPANVTWTAVADDALSLAIGSIAVQPGNSDVSKSVILAATGEANNSSDSYYGLGILRSADGGGSWTLIHSANGGALSFSGLGGTRMAFSTANGQSNTVVSAMGTSNEGTIDGAVSGGTLRGLYTSPDAGLNWNYDALTDAGAATDATSATAVVFNSGANSGSGSFFAAIRYHGFYSSPDGVTWTRLANQPGGMLLDTTACPANSASNNFACPIFRGEITAVPGLNEMYAWIISLDGNGNPVDGGIWQSLDSGNSWSAMNNSEIANCGDPDGCGVEESGYNLALMAMPNGAATDLYAGTINLYKCSITVLNPTCNASGFINLTHAFGCVPIAAPAHVHPNQHALAFTLPTAGSDNGGGLIYFANDGGIYRALDGYSGLNGGTCLDVNRFDDLNQNLGSLAQFVSFSQNPTDPNTLLGGTQGNGSPATGTATTSLGWTDVNGGDGGYNAIDPNSPSNFFVSNADVAPGGLNILECSSGANCHQQTFNAVVGSDDVGGDDGAFYVPYVLDSQSSSALILGTCRVWRGPRTGGAYTVLSPNFDTLGSGDCLGSEINLVRALAAGGPADGNGSQVIYATTDGTGPLGVASPSGGNVWVTTNATAGVSAFSQVTQNINPNQFPVSAVAIDGSDVTGKTAYVTIMGFMGAAAGHVWKTTDAGSSWTDFSGTVVGASLPDAPVNTVIVDASTAPSTVFVGTDVGVFASGAAAPSWSEVGPSGGFLPNVAVTALAIFNSGGQKLLRASTYGRGMWQSNLIAVPDFAISITNSPQTVFLGQTATFTGTDQFLNGYTNSITLSCIPGTTFVSATCTPNPPVLSVGTSTFTVTAGGVPGDYGFAVQGVGADSNHLTRETGTVTLHVVTFDMTAPTPASVSIARGTTSPPVSFQITAGGSFNQTVEIGCTVDIAGGTCALTPGNSVNPTASTPVNMTATVTVPAGASPGNYTASLQATTSGAPPINTSFGVIVTSNPDFIMSEVGSFPLVDAGSTGETGGVAIASQDGFAGSVALSCSVVAASGTCAVSPSSVASFPASARVTLTAPALAAGSYQMLLQGTSGVTTHVLAIPFNVGDYQITGSNKLNAPPGALATANLQIVASTFYAGTLTAACDHSALSGSICTLSPANPISVAAGATIPFAVSIDVPNDAAPGNYGINISTQDTSGNPHHNFMLSLTINQDFSITSATPSQTVTAGQTSGAYQLSVAPNPPGGSFPGAITLSCGTGLPTGAQCVFSSTPVTPGSSAVNVVLTISTSSGSAQRQTPNRSPGIFYVFGLLMPALLITWRPTGQHLRHFRGIAGFAILLALAAGLNSCASKPSRTTNIQQSTGAGTYAVPVTGTSGAISHSTTVQLVVE